MIIKPVLTTNSWKCISVAEAREPIRASRPSKNQEQHNLPESRKVFIVALVVF